MWGRQLCMYVKSLNPVCPSPSSFCRFPMVWMCEQWGRGVSSVYVCMCVSSGDSLLPLIAFSHLCFLSLYSPPPPLCVFPALFSLLAGSGEHQLLHYIDPPPPCTHTQTLQLQCTVEIIQWSCHPYLAGKWSLSLCYCSGSCGWLGRGYSKKSLVKREINGRFM